MAHAGQELNSAPGRVRYSACSGLINSSCSRCDASVLHRCITQALATDHSSAERTTIFRRTLKLGASNPFLMEKGRTHENQKHD